jgi:BNR repeat-like domain
MHHRVWFLLVVAACSAGAEDTGADAARVSDTAAAKVPTWQPDVRLTNDPASSQTTINFARHVAVAGDGSVHVVWYDTQVRYTRSRDRGATFEVARAIAPSGDAQLYPTIAAAGTNVYAAWHAQQNGAFYIFFTRSTDGGASWDPARKISTSGRSAHPALAADGTTVHLFFHDTTTSTEILYARSTDRGATFAPQMQLTPPNAESWVGGITASAGRVVASWVDYRDANEEEYLRVSETGGATWGVVKRITADPGDSWAPTVAIAGSTIHVAWFDRRDAEYNDVDVEAWLDGIGTMVGLALPAAPPRTAAHYYLDDFVPRLEDKLHKIQSAAPAWVARGGDPQALQAALDEYARRFKAWAMGWEIYYKRSTDGGKTFGPDVRITKAPYLSQRPSIVAVGDRVDMVWFDGRDGTGDGEGETEIYAASSTDGGATWGPNVRLTTAAGGSLLACLAATTDRLHVVWYDTRDGNDEVYYKQQTR